MSLPEFTAGSVADPNWERAWVVPALTSETGESSSYAECKFEYMASCTKKHAKTWCKAHVSQVCGPGPYEGPGQQPCNTDQLLDYQFCMCGVLAWEQACSAEGVPSFICSWIANTKKDDCGPGCQLPSWADDLYC